MYVDYANDLYLNVAQDFDSEIFFLKCVSKNMVEKQYVCDSVYVCVYASAYMCLRSASGWE